MNSKPQSNSVSWYKDNLINIAANIYVFLDIYIWDTIRFLLASSSLIPTDTEDQRENKEDDWKKLELATKERNQGKGGERKKRFTLMHLPKLTKTMFNAHPKYIRPSTFQQTLGCCSLPADRSQLEKQERKCFSFYHEMEDHTYTCLLPREEPPITQ